MNHQMSANVFVKWVIKWRLWIVVASFLFILIGSLYSFKLDLNPSLKSRFLKDNPQVVKYKELQSDFGAEPLLIVVWEGGGSIWNDSNLNRVRELALRLQEIKGVESLVSISEFFDKRENVLDVETLRRLPLIRKLLVGNSDKKAVIAIVPEDGSIEPSEGIRMVRAVQDVVDNFILDNERAFVTGPLAMQSKAIELSRRDLKLAVIIVTIAVLIFFGFVYRSWRAVAAAFIISAAAITGACGMMAIMSIKLSQFSLIAIPILAAISLQDAVHLLEHFSDAKRKNATIFEACCHMYESCAMPCLWTTVTTAIGFAALLISDVEQIHSIGLVVVIGAPIALIISLLIVPAVMSGDTKKPPRKPKGLTSLVHFISRRAPWIVFGLIMLTLVAAYGLRYAHVSLDFPRIFRSDVPFQAGLDEMDDEFSGGASFEVMMEAVDGEDFTKPDKLALMASLQMALSLTAPVTTTLSPIDIGVTSFVLANGIPDDPSFFFKKSGALVYDLRRTHASPLENWLSGDLKKARIHARVRTDKQQHYNQLISALEYLRDSFAERGLDISWSGLALLYKEMEMRMVRELTVSFAIAFAGVMLFMILLFRSLKWGLLSMIPNLFPLAIVVGVMGWAKVGFSLGLIILPAVGIGLIVDDTIHVIWGLRRFTHEGYSTKEAVANVLTSTGRALILSTLVLITGFASLVFSPFISNNQLAIFMPLLLILALIFDLIGLPAMLLLLKRK